MTGRKEWSLVDQLCRERFGADPFDPDDVVEIMRPVVNPMVAARRGTRQWSDKPSDSRRGDPVEVGLRALANTFIYNRMKAGQPQQIERIGRSKFRFLAPDRSSTP